MIGSGGTLSVEQAAILARLKELPPLDWYREDCKTHDQKQHWSDCRLYSQWLQTLLQDYFSGRASDMGDVLLKERQFWILCRDQWLRLYELIQYAWPLISEASANNQVDIPATPGEMLIEILTWHAAGMFYPCVKGIPKTMARFSPQKAYREYEKRQKAKNKKDMQAYLEGVCREEMYFDAFLNYCLMICHYSKDATVKSKLKAYQRVAAEVKAELHKFVHPRNRRSGHQWINGSKYPLLSNVAN